MDEGYEGLPDDWDLEMEVWNAAGKTIHPDGTTEYLNKEIAANELRVLIAKLWGAYCDMEERAMSAERLIEGNV